MGSEQQSHHRKCEGAYCKRKGAYRNCDSTLGPLKSLGCCESLGLMHRMKCDEVCSAEILQQ
jgi:hypothetical protein